MGALSLLGGKLNRFAGGILDIFTIQTFRDLRLGIIGCVRY